MYNISLTPIQSYYWLIFIRARAASTSSSEFLLITHRRRLPVPLVLTSRTIHVLPLLMTSAPRVVIRRRILIGPLGGLRGRLVVQMVHTIINRYGKMNRQRVSGHIVEAFNNFFVVIVV